MTIQISATLVMLPPQVETFHQAKALGQFLLSQVKDNNRMHALKVNTCFAKNSAGFSTTTSGVFASQVIPHGDIVGSSWNRYVYRLYQGSNVDQNRCTTMCAFDHPNSDGSKCHFIAYESNICYLGNLTGETNLLNNPILTDLHLKIGRCTETISELLYLNPSL